jgi:electron transport complex protein RnfB
MNVLARRIHAALPQTQCTRCGYPDCAGYAQAIADGQAAINQCPPGGAEGIARLAGITGQAVLPLDPRNGIEGPRKLMIIDEDWCIGCALCLRACPTDAIVGTNKRMHSVLATWCTGCELCLPVCPVDCIAVEDVDMSKSGWAAWSTAQAGQALERYAGRSARLLRLEQKDSPPPEAREQEHKHRLVDAAMAKAKVASRA